MRIRFRQKVAITNEQGKNLFLWAPAGETWEKFKKIKELEPHARELVDHIR